MAATILIADDDAVQRRLVENMVQKCGYETLVVDSGDEVIALLTATETQAIDALVLDLVKPGLNRVIRAGYELLGLVTYFTVGPKEARAWTITRGTRAPQAAGVIHTDFEKGFIRAETIAY